MSQAGISKRRQATPQAPPRDFKPRKNGAPAIPATPPANVPAAPAAMPQPPMMGAQRSAAPAPMQQQRTAGRFNPMQGPMGTKMGTARQAAATMFMQPPQPGQSQPSMPSQKPSAMGAPATQAPVSMPQAPKRTAAQRAALDVAGLGPMMAMSGQAPQPESGQGRAPFRAEGTGQERSAAPVPESSLDLSNAANLLMGLGSTGAGLLDASQAFGPDVSVEALQEYAGRPGRAAALVQGLGTGVSPDSLGASGALLDYISGAIKDAPEEGYDEENLFQNVMDTFLSALTGESDTVITDDMIQAQAEALKKEAADAKMQLAQQMAMRGMGASGLVGAGFGQIDSDLQTKLNKLYTDAATLNAEAGLNKAQIAGSIMSALQSDETRRELAGQALDYQKEQDAIANAEILKQHAVAMFGADGWAAGESGKVTELLDAGVPWHEIESRLKVEDGYVVFGEMGPEEKQALIDKYSSGGSPAQPGQKSEDGSTFTNPDGTFYLNEDGDFMSLDDLQGMFDSEDPEIRAKFEAAKAKFEQASGGSVGNTKEAWENLTNEFGRSELSNDMRREFLGFLAQELGFTFPPPGVEYDQWHGMPENLRAKYWSQYMDGEQGGYGSVWSPYGSSTGEGAQGMEAGEQGDGQDAQGDMAPTYDDVDSLDAGFV
jgi:hypothetical protein